MRNSWRRTGPLSGLFLLGMVLGGCGAVSRPPQPQQPTGDAKRGGQLYDKFWKVSGVAAAEPTADHPLWATRPDQASNTRTGADTWRCKECHGWDYKGVDGAYSTGSHRTGFAGILGTTLSQDAVFDLVKNDHGYGNAGLNDQDIRDLAAFVKDALVDTDSVITDGVFTGSETAGAPLYMTACAACHGTDGRSIPPGGDEEFTEFPGFLANDNAWEFLHKVRFGNPGTAMPAQFGILDLAAMGDLGAHAQTLPES